MEEKKKSKNLNKVSEKMFSGIFSRVTDSESVWIRIDNRSKYRKWTFKLSKKNLNLQRQEAAAPGGPGLAEICVTKAFGKSWQRI